MPTITVIKLDHAGNETYRYQGRLLAQSVDKVVLEAFFDREDTPVGKVVLSRGDRFIETYYSNRWYNIFEVHDREDDSIKCWYCNISAPAAIENNQVSYKDLGLDLLVYQDGQQVVLDEEEFSKLPLDQETSTKALTALAELRSRFNRLNPDALP